MQLSEDQILTLAPDESSKKSGRDLANPNKWISKGASELALWGECQGSGSKPYQTQVDLSNIAFKCSCPSRKFPCKHGLGLMLLYARDAVSFTNTEMPSWVSEWLEKRQDKKEKKEAKEEKPIDTEAQAKRQQARSSKVNDGIDELRVWIKDIIRNGIITIPEKGFPWFEAMAKRMIDAQAPGLANMIRNLGETNFFEEGWQSRFLNQLLNLFILTESFRNQNQLNELVQHEVKSLIGFTYNQEELKEQSGILDVWMVLSKQTNQQDNITTERFWLYGTSSKKYALVLQFIVRGNLPNNLLTISPGQFVNAELVYYPSVIPLRALIKKQISTTISPSVTGFATWLDIAKEESNLVSKFPIRQERAFVIEQVRPIFYNNTWWLQDQLNLLVELKNTDRFLLKLLAITGGKAMNMSVVGREGKFEVTGIWDSTAYKFI